MADSNPYSSVIPLAREIPKWINPEDGRRFAAYKTYDDMYNNNPDTFELMLRGVGDLPILVPSGKSIVNTLARYVGRGFGFKMDPNYGTPEQQMEAIPTLQNFFDREDLLSKFAMAVKEYLKFGDVFWYLQADSEKPEGSRISLTTVDPALVQPMFDDDDPDKVVGYAIVEQIKNGDTVVIQRQRWLKYTSILHPQFGNPEAPVIYDKVKLEIEGWETDEQKVVESIVPATPLPVVQLPLYHWKNNPETGNPFGSSELRGLERLMAGVNQSATDEDLALAIAGLGMWKSSSGGPEGGDWVLGPGRVVEDSTFERVDGVKSVSPSLEHIRYLEEKMDAATGITDVTRGLVEASTAESGIALSIRMSPTVDYATEKDTHIKGVFDQLLYDLRFWFDAVEGINMLEVRPKTAFGDKLPTNRAAEIKELLELLAAKVVSVQWVQAQLQDRFGYKIPEDMMQQIQEDAARATAAADPYGARMGEESAGDTPPDPDAEV